MNAHRAIKYFVALTITLGGFASPARAEQEGRGTLGRDLQDFKVISDPKILKLNADLIKKIEQLKVSQIEQLKNLGQQLLSPLLEMTEDAFKNPNQFPGDWKSGGLLYGYTDLMPGAPTMIYPVALGAAGAGGLSDVQLTQLLLHEGLHRALPNPLNGVESLVVSLTQILSTYADDSVVSAAKTVLSQYLNLKPQFYVKLAVDPLKGTSVDEPLGDDHDYIRFPLDAVNRSLLGALDLKQGVRLRLADETTGLTQVSRFSLKATVNNASLVGLLVKVENEPFITLPPPVKITEAVFISGGALTLNITDNWSGDTDIVELDLRESGLAKLIPANGKAYRYVVAGTGDVTANLYDNATVTTAQEAQAQLITKLLRAKINEYFDAMDLLAPVMH